jgi:hypothetical protein
MRVERARQQGRGIARAERGVDNGAEVVPR